ncbi:MAG: hypothetical protein JW845_03780 [Dehalococcoidales bacterium]|nr:hypothetical protein [Dehalococcoidales bacterium]
MPSKKSETVKANIDLKKGAIQLEGPQEFVEKYLDKYNSQYNNSLPAEHSSTDEIKEEVKSHQSNEELDRNINEKLEEIRKDIISGHLIQKRTFLFAIGFSIIAIAIAYYPSILEKMGLETIDFYVTNFSGFLGLATFVFIYAILSTKKVKQENGTDKEEKPSTGIGILFTFSFNLFFLALINKNLDVSSNITGWQKSITSGWYYLIFIGLFFLILAIYFKLPKHKIQMWLLKNIFNKYTLQAIKLLGWAIILVLFGSALIKSIQSDWAAIVGMLCIGAGIGFLVYGFIYCIVTGINLQKAKKIQS